jgi:archaellin
MWKILVAFIIFAAVALTLVFNMGDKIDMQGESGNETSAEHAPAAAPTQAPVAAPTAEAEKK